MSRTEEFFQDIVKIATIHLMENHIQCFRIAPDDNGQTEYQLTTRSPLYLIKLFKLAERIQKACNLDCVNQEWRKWKKLSVPEKISTFREMVGNEDEHIASPTCSTIEFFPLTVTPDREAAYIAYNISAWTEGMIPDSLERIETLLHFAQGRSVEGRELHLTH